MKPTPEEVREKVRLEIVNAYAPHDGFGIDDAVNGVMEVFDKELTKSNAEAVEAALKKRTLEVGMSSWVVPLPRSKCSLTLMLVLSSLLIAHFLSEKQIWALVFSPIMFLMFLTEYAYAKSWRNVIKPRRHP